VNNPRSQQKTYETQQQAHEVAALSIAPSIRQDHERELRKKERYKTITTFVTHPMEEALKSVRFF